MTIMKTVTVLLVMLIGSTLGNPVGSGPTSASCQPGQITLFSTESNPLSSPADTDTDNSTCPVGNHVQQHWSKRRAATCPWSYATNFDAARFPAVVSEAVCSCAEEGCLDPYTAQPRPDLQCTPVKYRVPVLRRGDCVDGVYEIVSDYESVTVACVCLRPESNAIRAPNIIG